MLGAKGLLEDGEGGDLVRIRVRVRVRVRIRVRVRGRVRGRVRVRVGAGLRVRARARVRVRVRVRVRAVPLCRSSDLPISPYISLHLPISPACAAVASHTAPRPPGDA